MPDKEFEVFQPAFGERRHFFQGWNARFGRYRDTLQNALLDESCGRSWLVANHVDMTASDIVERRAGAFVGNQGGFQARYIIE